MTNKSSYKPPIIKHFIYSEAVFKTMKELGFREYYTSSSAYIMLKHEGVWKKYVDVQKVCPQLPLVDLEAIQRKPNPVGVEE